jgi:uncharacterized protein YfdQ (DUF2303 family)
MDTNTVQKISDLGAAAAGKAFEANGRQFVMVPQNYVTKEIVPLEPLLSSYIEQTIRLETEDSFISYVKQFSKETTRLLYCKGTSAFGAIFDYHSPVGDGTPGRKAHKAALSLKHSDAWNAWVSINELNMGQVQFAEFLEDHLGDVRSPDGASMLEIASTLQINRKVSFTSAKRLDNGTVNFAYQEEDSAQAGVKGTFAVPQDIVLGLVVFDGDTEGYEVKAKFRHNLDQGKLTFKVKLLNLDRVVEAATADIVERIQAAANIEIWRGSL